MVVVHGAMGMPKHITQSLIGCSHFTNPVEKFKKALYPVVTVTSLSLASTLHSILFASLTFYLLLNNVVQVPTSLCSQECPVGYKKMQNGIHKCCFSCAICRRETYINSTGKLL